MSKPRKKERAIPAIVKEIDDAFWHDDTLRKDYVPRITRILRTLAKDAAMRFADESTTDWSTYQRDLAKAKRIARELVR